MKNLLKVHENLVIFPLNFSQVFKGILFGSVTTLPQNIVFVPKKIKANLTAEICA